MSDNNIELLTLTSDIVSAHVANNNVAIGDVANLIANVHKTLSTLGQNVELEKAKREPAVSIRSSVKPDHIVCLEDGAKLKMLKRYLRTRYNMTPEDYRAKWDLPRDYPMVAPDYAAKRKELAFKIGLGRKPAAPESPKPARKSKLKLVSLAED